VTLLPDDGENVVNRDRVLEISSVCDRSRDPDLLREMGRALVTVCRLLNDADLSRDRADNVVTRDELLTAERLFELYGVPKKNKQTRTIL